MSDWTPETRRLELHRMLRRGRKVVASQLAERFECHERTIRRALARMRDQERLPLEFDPSDATWRYTAAVDELPGLLVSGEDRRALLFSLQAAAQFEGTPVCNQIRHLYEALLATLPPEQATQFRRMMQSVRFTGPATPPIAVAVWNDLLLALEAGESIDMSYRDGNTGRTFPRRADPYGLTMRDRRWLLIGYCHYCQGVRAFSLPRIVSIETTDTAFKIPENFMDGYLADAFDGYQTIGAKLRFVLRIPRDAPSYVLERQWNPHESRSRDAKGNTIIKFQTAAVAFVEREICAEGGWVEVVEPKEVRESLRQRGKALTGMHK